ncbi:hypothetical protein F3Y22_tig00005929pilonHSYRG00161 [Hibiscus syriacus]|uniref:RRM domain-containing protein n=1 Tax=Hibiscus syriacus TaxID=106335 RepID=A0A6A3CEB0_HIBSY|nr:hypothetical protein F3Y22_tig00005929pilonHSYRG00161 [Hibiscus syriacus]
MDEGEGGDQMELMHRNEAISAVADDGFLGKEDDDYEDLYNGVNVVEGFLHSLRKNEDLVFRNEETKDNANQNDNVVVNNNNNFCGKVGVSPMGAPESGVSNPRVADGVERGDAMVSHESQGLPNADQSSNNNYNSLTGVSGMGQQGQGVGNVGGIENEGLMRQIVVGAGNVKVNGGGGGGGGSGPMIGNGVGNVGVASVVRDSAPGVGASGGGSGGGTILFVGDLHWWTTDAKLESELCKYEPVKEVKFFDEKAIGKSKGYCQVEFYDPAADAACKEGMNGHVFNGRPCVVAFASPFTVKKMGEARLNRNQQMAQYALSQAGRGRNDAGGKPIGINIQTGGNYQGGDYYIGYGRGNMGRGNAQGMGNGGPVGPMRNRAGGMGGRGIMGNGFAQGYDRDMTGEKDASHGHDWPERRHQDDRDIGRERDRERTGIRIALEIMTETLIGNVIERGIRTDIGKTKTGMQITISTGTVSLGIVMIGIGDDHQGHTASCTYLRRRNIAQDLEMLIMGRDTDLPLTDLTVAFYSRTFQFKLISIREDSVTAETLVLGYRAMEDKCHKGTQMEKASKILRTSIYKFLQSYQYLTAMAAILAFPYASSVLLSHLFAPSSSIVLPSICTRLMAIFSLPFAFTSFLVAKSSVFVTLNQQKPGFASTISLYKPLFVTYFCNLLCIISANSEALSLISFTFDLFEWFEFSMAPQWIVFMSVSGFLIYSFLVANTIVVCNLALVSSAVEEQSNGGCLAIVKACILLKGDAFSTGLMLTVAVNLELTAIEALFHYHTVKAYYDIDNSG